MPNCHHDPFTFDRWKMLLIQPGICLRCGEVLVRGNVARRHWRVMDGDFVLWLARRAPEIYQEMLYEQKSVRALITAMPRSVTDRFRLNLSELIVSFGK